MPSSSSNHFGKQGRLLVFLYSWKSKFAITDFLVSVFSILFVIVLPAVFLCRFCRFLRSPTSGSACQGVFTSRDPLPLLLWAVRDDRGPAGSSHRRIPFDLAKDFYASPSCLPFGPRGWSSLGGVCTYSTLRFSLWVLIKPQWREWNGFD